MKGNKKILAVALLLLLVAVSFSSYAIYRSTSTGTATVSTANWKVKLNGTEQTESTKTFTFTNSNINWTTSTSKVDGKVAPGSTGTITVELDATGSEVDVAYDVEVKSVKVDGTAVSNNAFTVAKAASDDGKLAYAASNMKKNIVLDVKWTGTNADDETKDTADKAMAGKDIQIEVEITVKQDLS